mmetsp:Transcript_31527/g.77244  ORF Transcript_31527/g.77244 Transcript_31527/m.77244 type:complete len:220 (-) Transcript_31527:91-750(-)
MLVALLVAAAVAHGARSVRPQDAAPDFTATAVMPNGKFGEVRLGEYAEKKRWLVFFTAPLAFTFVCTTEIVEFSDRLDEFDALGADVLGMTVDSEYALLAWTKEKRSEGGLGTVRFPLVSDLTKRVSKAYDVLLRDDSVTLRALFIIDPTGTVRHVTINDLPVGRAVDDALRTLRAFKYVDEHNDEVCPSQWKKAGDATITPDPEGKKKYFKAAFKDDL